MRLSWKSTILTALLLILFVSKSGALAQEFLEPILCDESFTSLTITSSASVNFELRIPLVLEAWTRPNDTISIYSSEESWPRFANNTAQWQVCVPSDTCLEIMLTESRYVFSDSSMEGVTVRHGQDGILSLNGLFYMGYEEFRSVAATTDCILQALDECAEDEALLEVDFHIHSRLQDYTWKIVQANDTESVVLDCRQDDSRSLCAGGVGLRSERHCLPRNAQYLLVMGGDIDNFSGGNDPLGSVNVTFDGVDIAYLTNPQLRAQPFPLPPGEGPLLGCSSADTYLELFVHRSPSYLEPYDSVDLTWSLDVTEKNYFGISFEGERSTGVVSRKSAEPTLYYHRQCVRWTGSCSELEMGLFGGMGLFGSERVTYKLALDGIVYGAMAHEFEKYSSLSNESSKMVSFAGNECYSSEVCDYGYDSLLLVEIQTSPWTPEWDAGTIEYRVANADSDFFYHFNTNQYLPGEIYRRFHCFSPFYSSCAYMEINAEPASNVTLKDYTVWVNGDQIYEKDFCDRNFDNIYCLFGYEGLKIGGTCSTEVDDESGTFNTGAIIGFAGFAAVVVGMCTLLIVKQARRETVSSSAPVSNREGRPPPDHIAPTGMPRQDAIAVPVPLEQPIRVTKPVNLLAANGQSLALGEDGDEDSCC